jgi:adenylate cyclase
MTTKELKRKLTAILSADVKGYSRLMGEDEEATFRTLNSYKEVMGSLIQQHRGRVVGTAGDSLLAEFASVVDAVQCAVEIQQVLRAKNAMLPKSRRMDFRIGINLGDVIEEGEEIYGDGVNIAARVEGLAEAGGICISESAYQQIENKLPLRYDYLGEHEVKNITKPVRVYRAQIESEAVARKPLEVASKEKMAFPLPDKPSIAVLPFVNMSRDPEQEYFSDGITEEIITALSKTPKLFVIARNSTFVYKGKPVNVKQVSQELGVKYVLEGSVRRSGDQLRITSQLIDATTGNHLWAERYDRQMKEIFAVQDDITKNIITTLQVQLTEGEQARVYAKGTDKLEAFLKVMEGWWHQQQSTKDGIFRTQKLAEEAIALDPNYAFAYYLLGASHYTFAWAGLSKNPQESLGLGIELNRKAITLDNSLGIAYGGLGYALIMVRQYDQATAAGERAISLEPNSAGVLHLYASILMFAGRNEEAIPFFKEALRLNPKPPNTYYRHYGNALANLGRYDEAIALQKKAIEQEPNDIFAYMVLASVCIMAGREAEARDAAREVLRLNPKFSVAQVDKIRPDKDRAVAKRWCDTLRQAGLPD